MPTPVELSTPWETQNEGRGAVYIFTRDDQDVWENTQKLLSVYGSSFGGAVALDDETLVVSESGVGERQKDVLHIYSRDSSGHWLETQELFAMGWADTINAVTDSWLV